MDLNDLQNLVPGAVKELGTGLATATGAVKAWNAIQDWRRQRVLKVSLSVRSAFYTRDYRGIGVVGVIRNPTGNAVQLTEWLLNLPTLKMTLSGYPRMDGLQPGSPWWPMAPFVIDPKRLSSGAVFFSAPNEWANTLPEDPLHAVLQARVFPDAAIQTDVEIRSVPRIEQS